MPTSGPEVVTASALALVAACAGAAPPAASPAATPAEPDLLTFDPCAASVETGGVSCAAWDEWPRMTAAAFASRGHRKAWVDVHVDPRFADAYRAGAFPLGEGARIVKVAYADDGGRPGEVTGLAVMAKMPAGYDPDHGDWFYGVYDATGTLASQQGRLAACIACHEQWAHQDYLGGVPDGWASAP